MEEKNKMNSDWRVDKIEIKFEKGYNFKDDPEERIDRYEGEIQFKNGENESFQFNIKPEMAGKYMDLISQEIVNTATELGEKLKKSLNLE
jgi:hypothetical protein